MANILIIEDELSVRENLAELLNAEGYTVSTAENGLVGFTAALKCKPDLIISDINMPVVDGHDALSAIRKNPHLQSVPFIFISASANCSDYLLGKSQGANHYLTKPFTHKDVLKVVEASL